MFAVYLFSLPSAETYPLSMLVVMGLYSGEFRLLTKKEGNPKVICSPYSRQVK